MRTGHICFPVAALAIAIAFAPSAGAQIIEPCIGGLAVGGIMYGIGNSREIAPFTGTVKDTFEQRLPDGNAIHRVTRSRQARDSAGRTMSEMAQGCEPGPDGEMHELLNVNVNDPVAKTSMSWQVGREDQPKVVHVFHYPNLAMPARQSPADPEQAAQQKKVLEVAQARALQLRKEQHIEDLGTRDFNGIPAQGTRTTRTIPAGEEGNDLPLVVINEVWRSRELGLVLMAINDDPRRGRTTTEYEELDRGEPNSSLFTPPADYKVVEQPEHGVTATAN
jgi:hypothetical protein